MMGTEGGQVLGFFFFRGAAKGGFFECVFSLKGGF